MAKLQVDLLVTFDQNYIQPFRTLLYSLLCWNPDIAFHVWLLHSTIPDRFLQELSNCCASWNVAFSPLTVDSTLFRDAPTSKRYPQEIYYRLLAPNVLPASLKRVLYLDPDILAINPIYPLWEMDLENCVFAAASHTGSTVVVNGVNHARLGTQHDYYNTGVMLIDLDKARKAVCPDEIFTYVSDHAAELMLPDQDVFNSLYGASTLALPDEIWNYDARHYSRYYRRSDGTWNLAWVMHNTVFLHFCGKRKPWLRSSSSRFAALYQHYAYAALTS